MKRLKRGFTLSEMLITLGIVGVVAAITIPSLLNNSIERTIAPSLAKTVHDVEDSFQNIIQAASDATEEAGENNAGALTLDAIRFQDIFDDDNEDFVVTSAEIFDTLRGASGTIRLDNGDFAYLNNARVFNANTLIRNDSDRKYGFINGDNGTIAYGFPKSKAVFIFEPATDDLLDDYASNHNNRIENDVVVARIAIDANGAESPNRFGQDIFLFGVANNGKLIPAGSAAYNNSILGNALNEILYTADNGCSGDNIAGNGASCAARVAADGWKINYKR